MRSAAGDAAASLDVPFPLPAWGRRVYPGFIQLSAFVSMNLERHINQHRKLQQLLAEGKGAEAAAIQLCFTIWSLKGLDAQR